VQHPHDLPEEGLIIAGVFLIFYEMIFPAQKATGILGRSEVPAAPGGVKARIPQISQQREYQATGGGGSSLIFNDPGGSMGYVKNPHPLIAIS
jgi:hypothetical protein